MEGENDVFDRLRHRSDQMGFPGGHDIDLAEGITEATDHAVDHHAKPTVRSIDSTVDLPTTLRGSTG